MDEHKPHSMVELTMLRHGYRLAADHMGEAMKEAMKEGDPGHIVFLQTNKLLFEQAIRMVNALELYLRDEELKEKV